MGIRIDWSWIILAIVVCIVLYLVSGCVVLCNTEAQCLEIGFPSYSVTWNLKGYCISLHDASAVVAPLR